MVVNRSAPKATVVPILVYEDVGKAIEWLCDTFGFRERLRARFRVAASPMRSSTLPRGPSCWAAKAASFGHRAPTR